MTQPTELDEKLVQNDEISKFWRVLKTVVCEHTMEQQELNWLKAFCNAPLYEQIDRMVGKYGWDAVNEVLQQQKISYLKFRYGRNIYYVDARALGMNGPTILLPDGKCIIVEDYGLERRIKTIQKPRSLKPDFVALAKLGQAREEDTGRLPNGEWPAPEEAEED